MNDLRTVTALVAAAIGSVVLAGPAAADDPVSCRDVVSGFLDEGAPWLEVAGVQMTSRGEVGFAGFTMRDGFQIESEPLDDPEVTARHKFVATRIGNLAYSGTFHMVFPDRGNGDEDRGLFWISRSGAIMMRSLTWGDRWSSLEHAVCYRGGKGQLIVTGQGMGGEFGTSYWSLIVQRSSRP
jgi:hypothetical protein